MRHSALLARLQRVITPSKTCGFVDKENKKDTGFAGCERDYTVCIHSSPPVSARVHNVLDCPVCFMLSMGAFEITHATPWQMDMAVFADPVGLDGSGIGTT